jgi:hypothetical protein
VSLYWISPKGAYVPQSAAPLHPKVAVTINSFEGHAFAAVPLASACVLPDGSSPPSSTAASRTGPPPPPCAEARFSVSASSNQLVTLLPAGGTLTARHEDDDKRRGGEVAAAVDGCLGGGRGLRECLQGGMKPLLDEWAGK